MQDNGGQNLQRGSRKHTTRRWRAIVSKKRITEEEIFHMQEILDDVNRPEAPRTISAFQCAPAEHSSPPHAAGRREAIQNQHARCQAE
eukprot:6181421-Pleurochrysis_carterae.AAC.1